MPQQRLLYLDANRLSASLWQGGTLREEGHFPHDEAGVAAFSEYLARHRGSIFHMLADIPDEGFQIEVLPYAQGADRRALLARKLGQYFYGSPLATVSVPAPCPTAVGLKTTVSLAYWPPGSV